MHIYDSRLKERVPFEPIDKNDVKIYVCGPTVYDYSHLGHARSAISFDLLRRVLRALGYSVKMAKNFTDIDDKIIKKAQEENKNIKEITGFYTEKYLEEMGTLGILRPDFEPKATENMEAMGKMILELLKDGYAYKTLDGSVYLDVTKDVQYGIISHKVDDETENRIDNDPHKKHTKDFALWKACKEGEEKYCFKLDGLAHGRPGWHIECSAMIESIFGHTGDGYSIDIHGGGADLLFPHHENEACQSRCATKKELSKYWMHNGFVNIDGEKMSKSLKNSFFIKDALENFSGEVLRFYLMSTHYRAPLHYNHHDLLTSKKRLDKLYRLKKRVYGIKGKGVDEKFKTLLLNALSDDLNTSKALAVIDEFVKLSNDFLDTREPDNKRRAHIVSNIAFIEETMGFGGTDAYAYFQHGIDAEEKETIEQLIQQRSEAKKEKDYAKADAIRDELTAKQIGIMDTPEGTVWEKLEVL